MRLENLHLINFKNYAEAVLDFRGNIHCFLGRNGSGKTNLLDAIHYLSFTKSGIQPNDLNNIRQGQYQFMIKGRIEKEGKLNDVTCTYAPEEKKKISENGKTYSRFSQHIGKYPLVLVAPNDIELIWDGGEIRRKFFDSLLSQLDKEYLEHLIIYQAQLRQRNGLLRMFAEGNSIDRDLIASYDDPLAASGIVIHRKRMEFANQYQPVVRERYGFLVDHVSETAGLTYESELHSFDFKNELRQRLERDVLAGRTTIGIHRDDFLFTMNGNELKKFGSQGQQKSYLIALKLAEFDCLKKKNGFNPLLLLDDIFDKLDDDRIVQLMKLVSGGTFGQIFITDARPGRSLEVLKAAKVPSQNFIVEAGTVSAH